MVAVLRKEDRNRTLRLRIGERVRLELDQVGGTGYRWTTPRYNELVLRLESDTFSPPGSHYDSSVAGASGIRCFEFSAVSPGESQIETVPLQPWDSDEDSASRFNITVKVGG